MSIVALTEAVSHNEKDQEISKTNESKSWWIVDAAKFVYNLPFTSIVRYVYKEEPLILFTVIGSNWILPSIIELMAPWYLSTHSILSETTILQHDLNQQLNSTDLSTLSINALYKIVGLTLYYSTLKTVTRYLNGRINLRLRILMRRLIIEKIIYSEIDSLQNAYHSSLGSSANTARVLERTIMRDLNSSISVIFDQIPALFTHSSRLSRNVYYLYSERDKLDHILIFYPFLYQFTREIVGALTTWDTRDSLNSRAHHSKQLMSKLITNTVIGLHEIQIMNYSPYQLNKLNVLMNEYFDAKYSMNALFMNVLDEMRNHSILRWLFDVLLEIKLRNNRYNSPDLTVISHKEYNKMKVKCNTLYNSVTKLYRSINGIRYNIYRQLYLKKLLYLPGFVNEEKELKQLRGFDDDVEFEYIEFKYIYFKYKENYASKHQKEEEEKEKEENINITRECIDDQVELIKKRKENDIIDVQMKQESNVCPFKLLLNENIRFERGKTYGICGRNESGKTTFVDVFCKLRKPQFMECIVNGSISYDLVSRVEIRKQISYISQRPYLFEGSVGENIAIANPDATMDEIKAAATLGGVFLSMDNNYNYNENKSERGRGKYKKRYRNRRRRRKKTIATHMVEGIVNWRNNNNDDDAIEVNKDDIKNENNGGFLDYIYGFFNTMDNKQIMNRNSLSLNDLYDENNVKKQNKNKNKKEEYDNKYLSKTDYKHDILNYEINNKHDNVSGGMIQSIALSRVFLRKQSKIVICDESFNSMDNVKKNAVIYPELFKFIRKYNMTLIMISHNILECFQDLDHIIVFESGTLHNQGHHQYLIENSALYEKLCGQK